MKRDKGFTLLEVAIAITIFSFLLISVSKLMGSEIRIYNSARDQNEIEQKTRTALMHMLDEIRLNRYTYYYSSSGFDTGVYSNDPDFSPKERCLIDVNPDPDILGSNDLKKLPKGIKIYYDSSQKELWYVKDASTNTKYLIADEISSISIMKVTDPLRETDHLIRIYIAAGDPSSAYYELVTWARLY